MVSPRDRATVPSAKAPTTATMTQSRCRRITCMLVSPNRRHPVCSGRLRCTSAAASLTPGPKHRTIPGLHFFTTGPVMTEGLSTTEPEVIRVGQIEIRYLHEAGEGRAMGCFELRVPPGSNV